MDRGGRVLLIPAAVMACLYDKATTFWEDVGVSREGGRRG